MKIKKQMLHVDTGCELYPSCLSCPRPLCIKEPETKSGIQPSSVVLSTINRTAVAKFTHYTKEHISQVCLGKTDPSLECAHSIADYLGITLDALYVALRAEGNHRKNFTRLYYTVADPTKPYTTIKSALLACGVAETELPKDSYHIKRLRSDLKKLITAEKQPDYKPPDRRRYRKWMNRSVKLTAELGICAVCQKPIKSKANQHFQIYCSRYCKKIAMYIRRRERIKTERRGAMKSGQPAVGI